MKKKQGFLLLVCVGIERRGGGGATTRVKTAHASILCAIKGIPRERKRKSFADGSSSSSSPSSFFFLFGRRRRRSSSSKEDRNRWTSVRGKEERREKSFSSADAAFSIAVAACAEQRERETEGLLERKEKDSQSFSGFGDDRVCCVSLQEAEK